MSSENVMKLKINEKSHSYAKIYAALIKDEFQRKRAYASLVALYSLIDALERTDNTVQKSMTLFRNPVLNEQYEISDLYINNWHIDVRVVVDGDFCLVPKIHYDNNITPDYYAVVKIDKTLHQAELLGFACAETVQKEPFDYHYCSVPISALISYDEFLSKVCKPKTINFRDDDHDLFKELYLSLMDEEMKPEVKSKVLKHLFLCPECRTEFCCFTGFEMVSCKMSSYPNIFDDMTLSIVGAQAVDETKYAGQEKTIYFGADADKQEDVTSPVSNVVSETETVKEVGNPSEKLETEETSTEKALDDELQSVDDIESLEPHEEPEMTVSDILDELFNMEEDYIEPEHPTEKEPALSVEKEPELPVESTIPEKMDDSEFDRAVDEKIREAQEAATFEEDEPLDFYIDDEIDAAPVLNQEITTEEIMSLPTDEDEVLENTHETNLIDDVPAENLLADDVDLEQDDAITEYIDEDADQILELDSETITNVSDDMQLLGEDASNVSDLEGALIEEDEPITLLEEFSSEKENIETEEELEVIKEADSSEASDFSEVDDDNSDDVEIISSDDGEIEFHDDLFEDAEELVQSASKEAKESIQQVIVDYDEEGEPVYSYITNVSQEAELITDDISSEFDDDDDILNQEFQTFETYQEEVYTSTNPDIPVRPVEYVQNGDEIKFENEQETTKSQIEDTADILLDEKFDDYQEEINVPKEASISTDGFIDEPAVVPASSLNQDFEIEHSDEVQQNAADEMEATDLFDENSETSDDEYDEDEGYEEEEDDDDEYDDEEDSATRKSSIIALLVVLLVLVAGGIGAFFFFKNKNQETSNSFAQDANVNSLELPPTIPTEPAQVTDMFGDDVENQNQDASGNDFEQLPPPPLPQVAPPPPPPSPVSEVSEQTKKQLALNNSIANAFTKSPNNLSLKSLNWKCSPQMYSDAVFKAYMQDLDKVLKMNIRKNILDVTETPASTEVAAKMAIDKSGNLNKVIISTSSGSQQLDNVVLQSINETFQGGKTQNLNESALQQDLYYLKVVIKL